jgi:hypothetical protein
VVGTTQALLRATPEDVHVLYLDGDLDAAAPDPERCQSAAAMAVWLVTHGSPFWAGPPLRPSQVTVIGKPLEKRHGYASVNGLKMYYEIHGAGKPLVLPHGGGSTIDTFFGKILPAIAKTRQVIALSSKDTGAPPTPTVRSPSSSRPMTPPPSGGRGGWAIAPSRRTSASSPTPRAAWSRCAASTSS